MIVSSQKELLSGYIDDIKKDICSMNKKQGIFHWKAAYSETCGLSPVDIYKGRHSEKKNNTRTV